MNEKEIKRKISEGMVRCRVIVEIAGSPKQHVKKTLSLVVENMKKDEDLTVLKEEFFTPKKTKEFYHAFAELEVLFSKPTAMLVFCIDYAPSSVEIMEPESMTLAARDWSGLLNDFLAVLHRTAEQVRKVNTENKILNNNARNLLRNLIYVSLKENGRTLEELATSVAVPAKQLEPFLDLMLKEGKLKKEKNFYRLR
jgi:hypothetical protein